MTSTTSDHLTQVAQKWILAFNTKNIELLLSLYHANAIHISPKKRRLEPESKGLISGHKNLHDWWNKAFIENPSLNYTLERCTQGKTHVFLEYTRTVEHEEATSVVELLEFDGLCISRSRVYNG
jgi:hypothetical protein